MQQVLDYQDNFIQKCEKIVLLQITCRIFLGFEFLVRNEKKNGIPHEKREKNEKNSTP